MLSQNDYEKILQQLSFQYYPDISLLDKVEINYKGKIKKFKNEKIFDAYTWLQELDEKQEKYLIHFTFKDSSLFYLSENFAFDLIYT